MLAETNNNALLQFAMREMQFSRLRFSGVKHSREAEHNLRTHTHTHTFIVMLQPRQAGLEQYENVIKKERRLKSIQTRDLRGNTYLFPFPSLLAILFPSPFPHPQDFFPQPPLTHQVIPTSRPIPSQKIDLQLICVVPNKSAKLQSPDRQMQCPIKN